MRIHPLAAGMVIAMAATTVQAEGLFGELSAGYIANGGNSETRSSNAKAQFGYVSGRWKNELKGSLQHARDDGDTTAERYSAGYKLDYSFTDNDYLFFTVDFDKDLFGGVRERLAEAVGYGRKLINTDRHKLDAEIGVGARQIRLQGVGAERESEFIGRANGQYRWILTETSEFSQRLMVESGDENTFTESISELKLSIIGNLFASLSYTVRNNSDVAPGLKKTDTVTAVNLSYKFGQQ